MADIPILKITFFQQEYIKSWSLLSKLHTFQDTSSIKELTFKNNIFQ